MRGFDRRLAVFRRGGIRRAIRRRLRGHRPWWWGAALGAALAGVGAAVGIGGLRWAQRSPLFAVTGVRVVGAHRARPEALVQEAALGEGMSVFADLRPRLQRLETNPLLLEVRVRRLPPHRLLLEVEEREPVALVLLGEVRPVAQDGVLLPAEAADLPGDLPLIELPSGPQPEMLGRALFLLQEVRKSDPVLWQEISQVRVTPEGGLDLALQGGQYRVAVRGEGLGAESLALLRSVLADLREAGVRRAAIDLRFRGQAVVTPGTAGGQT